MGQSLGGLGVHRERRRPPLSELAEPDCRPPRAWDHLSGVFRHGDGTIQSSVMGPGGLSGPQDGPPLCKRRKSRGWSAAEVRSSSVTSCWVRCCRWCVRLVHAVGVRHGSVARCGPSGVFSRRRRSPALAAVTAGQGCAAAGWNGPIDPRRPRRRSGPANDGPWRATRPAPQRHARPANPHHGRDERAAADPPPSTSRADAYDAPREPPSRTTSPCRDRRLSLCKQSPWEVHLDVDRR
jgi:hypothetical protein